MILKWTDRDYGQHFLEVGDTVTFLGNYAHDEPRPNYGHMYGRSTHVSMDPPRATIGAHVGEDPGASGEIREHYEFAETLHTSTIACLFCPEYGHSEEGLLQLSVLALFLVNDRGDTIDTLVRSRPNQAG